MKKLKIVLLSIVTISFNILFYEQGIGLNVLVFHLISITTMISLSKVKLTNKNIILLLTTSTISAVSCFYYGDAGSLIIYNLNLIPLTAIILNPNLSIFTTVIAGVSSLSISLIYSLSKEQPKDQTEDEKKKTDLFLLIVTIPIILLFIIIYAFSNPVVASYIKQINLNFISLKWIMFTLLSSYVLFGLIYGYSLKSLNKWDKNQAINYNSNQSNSASLFKSIDIIKSGIILFSALNVILLLVNLTDVIHFSSSNLQETDTTLSSTLHQSIGTLIFSIILAVTLVLIYYNKAVALNKKNKWFKYLVIVWIIQNIVLITLCFYKNFAYVDAYGLTLKRLGVYVYLSIAIIGLSITYLKVKNNKTNWYLITRMTTGLLVSLSIVSIINWEKIVIEHNVNQHLITYGKKPIDWYYLSSLSNRSTPHLLEAREKTIGNDFTKWNNNPRNWSYNNNDYYQNEKINLKTMYYIKTKTKQTWQEYKLSDNKGWDIVLKHIK